MIPLYEKRASAILFNFLQSNTFEGYFLLPANVCPIVPLTFMKARVPFRFVDISMDRFCIDPGAVFALIKDDPACRGVLFVRTYGIMDSFESFFSKIKTLRPGIVVIDDRCLAPPDFELTHTGEADLILYSTGYAKYIDIQWGGFGYMRENFNYTPHPQPFDPGHLETVTRNYKQAVEERREFQYTHSHWLDNRTPPVPFAHYKQQVTQEMETITRQKEAINRHYQSHLPASLQLPARYHQWRFNIRVGNKQALLRQVFDAGLFASSHYAPLTRVFAGGEAKNTEKLHDTVVNLFNDRYFDLKKAKHITQIVLNHIQENHENQNL